MKSDIRKYISLRDGLMQERSQLEARLREITEALGETGAGARSQASAAVSAPAVASRQVATRGRRGRRGGGGGLSLRDAVLQITSSGARTKEEILEGVQRLGYRFSTNNPLNSLGVILYGKNPKFKNDSGRFSPAGGGSSSAGVARSQGGQKNQGGGRKRRTMSPEARERIAAAQRARWAKAKGK